MRPNAVVLVSGGMDSLVTLAVAARDHTVYALHLNYRQRTERRELRSFGAICRHYGIPTARRRVVDISFLGRIGGSALTDRKLEVPRTRGHGPRGGIPVTYVPFRNTIILSLAVAWAETVGAKKVFIGAVEEDSSGYPDCRKTYYEAFNRLVKEGTRPGSGIRVVTPLIAMSKGEIVRLGLKLNAPFHLSWSCYVSDDRPCGTCDSCRLRAKGFEEAGVPDPILKPRIKKAPR